MAKLFLRSGSLDDFLALGENGQPVYASALQLRETLRLRKQQQIADCLAIPQPNEHGDRIDWYSPVDGKVTSWIAASEEEREKALALLETYQAAVADISQRAQNAEKAGQKLFGVLLAKAIQFPGANHVYLVDGKPVLTFWGFVNLDKKSRLDALDCLRPVIKEAEPLFVAPAPAATLPLVDPVPEPEPQPVRPPEPVEPAPAPAAAAAAVPVRPPFFRLWWLLPAAALLAILSLQIRGCVSGQDDKPASDLAATVKPEKRALPSSTPVEPAPQQESAPVPPVAEKEAVKAVEPAPPVASVPAAEATKPEAPAATEPKEPVTPPAEPVVEQVPAIPAGKDDLVMPADAVKIGSIKFLNGNWRVIVDGKAPITGRPPSLRYQIQNGKGTARITHGDGVTCRANVEAGLMSSGNLIINSRSGARCSDNSRFQMPELVCKQGASGTAAECIGRYDADTVFPMTIKRESK
ncbi:SrfA family protein [Pectobacterium aroidearum]|uniref:SrfA family protein n=1 Tax=Pectobacterium aroidearum TaxID=1201031 RepID=UPI002115724D|nr:SrfA family protein [Pectobacterium aroidearum]UUE47042.1 SrfA family protein [Pectobacterium aroidearum]UUE51239.1 SrfA family protein [Pectobacterium aroidearum]UUE55468.1 SrfA family protein [Pectobacterium aroidearum]UUE63876.1 SrfA family protein [Pectobacterium aroidearum]UUE68101.1 SrfA family protein [Pectobacterium aroidearum]